MNADITIVAHAKRIAALHYNDCQPVVQAINIPWNTALPGSRELEAEEPVRGVSEIEHALGQVGVTVQVRGVVGDNRGQDRRVIGWGRAGDRTP